MAKRRTQDRLYKVQLEVVALATKKAMYMVEALVKAPTNEFAQRLAPHLFYLKVGEAKRLDLYQMSLKERLADFFSRRKTYKVELLIVSTAEEDKVLYNAPVPIRALNTYQAKRRVPKFYFLKTGNAFQIKNTQNPRLKAQRLKN